jgi:hypothetical protein
MYVYRKTNHDFSLIPKGLYVKMPRMTYNPFGIWGICFKCSYKHKFPLGMCDEPKCDIKPIIPNKFVQVLILEIP